MQIEESLHFQYNGYKDGIEFYNDIMSDQVKNPHEQHIHYKIKK